MLALLDEERDTCSQCGHQISECRDPKTAGSWQVVSEICEPGRVIEATLDNARDAKTRQRGLHVYARRTGVGREWLIASPPSP